jgi:hypothetical protein
VWARRYAGCGEKSDSSKREARDWLIVHSTQNPWNPRSALRTYRWWAISAKTNALVTPSAFN